MVSSSLPKILNGTGGSNVTSQPHPGGTMSHSRSMSSSSSRKLPASVPTTNNSTSWNSASYLEALNVLSDETMSQACALVLHGTGDGDDRRKLQPSPLTSSVNKNDTSAEDTNARTESEQQEEQDSRSSLPTSTVSTLETRQQELEKLQQLFSRCCQAASTYERESQLLQQQKSSLPSHSGLSSAIPGGGTMARPKAPAGVILNAPAAHRTSLLRNGSGRAPPGASTLPIVATSSKGSMGAAISTISGGIHRRRPLEREKSDSSSATTASSSKAAGASSSYLKAATRHTADDSGNRKNGKNGAEVVPPPPPSALQFLAMLNKDTANSTKVKKAESATEVVEPKRSGDTNSVGSISPPSAKRVKVSLPKMAPSDVTTESSPVRIQPPRASRK